MLNGTGMKTYFLLYTTLYLCLSTVQSSQIPFERLNCNGDVTKFKNFFRVIADTHDSDDGPFVSSCKLPSYKYAEKKYTSYVFGLRMSDTNRHFEFNTDDDIVGEDGTDILKNDDDYILFNFGSAKAYVTVNHLQIFMREERQFGCEINFFQDESSKDFSVENYVYVMVTLSERGTVSVSFSKNKRWELCGETKVLYPGKKTLEWEAKSDEGINIDLTHLEINPQNPPWSQQKTKNELIETSLEHAEERMRVNKNAVEQSVVQNMNRIWWLRIHLFLLTATVAVLILSKLSSCNRKSKHAATSIRSYAYGHDHLC